MLQVSNNVRAVASKAKIETAAATSPPGEAAAEDVEEAPAAAEEGKPVKEEPVKEEPVREKPTKEAPVGEEPRRCKHLCPDAVKESRGLKRRFSVFDASVS